MIPLLGISSTRTPDYSVLVTLHDGSQFNFPKPDLQSALNFAELVRLRGFSEESAPNLFYASGAVKSTEVIA